MSKRSQIIEKISRATTLRYDMPNLEIEQIEYTDLITQFSDVSKQVGGQAVILNKDEDINSLITSLYPDARNIASNLMDITIATINPDTIADPHELKNLDLAIIEGEIGVAENAGVWIPQQVRQKVIYFIAENLVIVLDKNKLVATMHDAYHQIDKPDFGFGVFISGPSKTADIEQALVIGAHGARGVTVVLR